MNLRNLQPAVSSLPPEAAPWIARLIFGLSGVLFGLGHLTDPKGPAHMIPPWMPFGAPFWILISGIGFTLAGLGILSGILNRLAAMLLIFEIILVPILLGYPHVRRAWGASAYNLAVAGAVLIFAESLPSHKSRRSNPHQDWIESIRTRI